jgi:hypothetical protein
MLDGGFIQNSKLLIQNFAACAECAFPNEHRSFQSSVFRGEPGLPNFNERRPVGLVCGFQGSEVFLPCCLRLWGKFQFRKVEASEQFEQEEANRPAIEVCEGVNGQKPSLCKRKKLQGEIAYAGTGFLPPSGKISAIIAHKHWNHRRLGRFEIPDANINRSPFSCPIWNQFDRDEVVNFSRKIFIKGVIGKITAIDAGFNNENFLGEEWSYLGVGEDAPHCFNKAGSSSLACIA